MYPQWDIFPTSTNQGLPNFQYTVVQRTFGPWDDFGHLPLFGLNITENNFIGDKRGFHLGEHKATADSDPQKASSRVHQKFGFTLGRDHLATAQSNRLSSGTIGIRNMCPSWVPSIWFFPGPGMPSTIAIPCDGTAPCDWGNACEIVSIVDGLERFKHNTLYMHSYARDECVDFSTNIDQRCKLTFDIQSSQFENFLVIKGVLLNKGFPAHEVYIEDQSGQKLFLYTYGPGKEEDIVTPGLLPAHYDELHHVNIHIEIDGAGNFKETLFVGELVDQVNWDFSSPSSRAPYKDVAFLQFQPNLSFDFDFESYSLSDWNALNLQKPPAGDCLSIPCCGNLGCCSP